MVKNARSINPFGLRMPEPLRELLAKAAADNSVSINTEIVKRLEASFQGMDPRDVSARFEALEEEVAELRRVVERGGRERLR